VRVSFPITVDDPSGGSLLEARSLDLGLGGIRAELDDYLELYTRVTLRFDLAVTRRDGTLETTPVEASAAMVRIDPGEPTAGAKYDASFSFTRPSEDRDRNIAIFVLQMLLFDPKAELI
jgi:hypothetical protein